MNLKEEANILGTHGVIFQGHVLDTRNIFYILYELQKEVVSSNAGVGKSRFTVVNTQLTLVLFINYVLFSIQTTVNLLLPHLVLFTP